MAPQQIYPRSNAECVALLKALGFKKKLGTGRGPHPQKYYHPTKRNQNLNDKPFVLVTHEYFDEKAMSLMKKLENWGFTPEEIAEKCKNL
jgi:hypothetical protein